MNNYVILHGSFGSNVGIKLEKVTKKNKKKK